MPLYLLDRGTCRRDGRWRNCLRRPRRWRLILMMNPLLTQISQGQGSADRAVLVRAAAHALQWDGWSEIRAQDCPGFRAPQAVVVPDLNVPLQPDLCASHPARPAPLLACVGMSDELREPAIGRRWLALAAWATDHQASFAIFVQPRDYARARAIAARWRLDHQQVRTLPTH